MQAPRICIAATKSGSGKTLLTCGLLQLLKNQNLQIAGIKCGPDFIDPMFHAKVLGVATTNLDTFFTDEATTNELLGKHAKDKDITVMEGVMGFYDGIGATSVRASTYDIAKTTKTPVILVLDMKGMSVSSAAVIKGFLEYKKDNNIKGIFLNRISAMLYKKMKKFLEEELFIPVIGYLPEDESFELKSRHLGLFMPNEISDFKERIQKIAETLKETFDFTSFWQIANGAPDLLLSKKMEADEKSRMQTQEHEIHLAVAKDDAFCFIYEDNIDYLKRKGAKITYFSPLCDKEVPKNIDGLILYGGYPEIFAKELSENKSMIASVKEEILNKKIPVIAECGGFLYLTNEITTQTNETFDMANVIDTVAWKEKRLKRFGYITLTGNAFLQTHSDIKAHEFHYYETNLNGTSFVATKANKERSWECIHATDTMMIGFPHCYYYGNESLPDSFLHACQKYQKARENKGDK